jgi:hypothetical protein
VTVNNTGNGCEIRKGMGRQLVELTCRSFIPGQYEHILRLYQPVANTGEAAEVHTIYTVHWSGTYADVDSSRIPGQ